MSEILRNTKFLCASVIILMDASCLQGLLALADNFALHPLIQIIDCKKTGT